MLHYRQPQTVSGIQSYAFINPYACRLVWGEAADLARLTWSFLHMSLILLWDQLSAWACSHGCVETQEHKPPGASSFQASGDVIKLLTSCWSKQVA